MVKSTKKYQNTTRPNYLFSVIIPTWNNLAYLKICLASLRKNSSCDLQLIVCVNEGKDGTLEWLATQNDIDYLHNKENLGVCYSLNICRGLVKAEYIIYLNDDMYVLPQWDVILREEVEQVGKKAYLSSTTIEPYDGGNPCVIYKNYGRGLASFQEELLLKEYKDLSIPDWNGATWPPSLVHIDLWDLVGGLSAEFSPGMYSDPDFAKKLYEAGIRIFKGKGNSLVYHFGSKSTNRIKKNAGRRTFLLKWGITSNTFMSKYLERGKLYRQLPRKTALGEKEIVLNKIKRMISCFGNYHS